MWIADRAVLEPFVDPCEPVWSNRQRYVKVNRLEVEESEPSDQTNRLIVDLDERSSVQLVGASAVIVNNVTLEIFASI